MSNSGRVARVMWTADAWPPRGRAHRRLGRAHPRAVRRARDGAANQVHAGHSLVFTPDPQHRIIFETDGKVVTRYRAGRMPEVEWVEKCG
jgi:hypothetical protein